MSADETFTAFGRSQIEKAAAAAEAARLPVVREGAAMISSVI